MYHSPETERSLSEHVAVFEAVRSTDPGAAASLLGEHVGHLAQAYCTKLFSEAAYNTAAKKLQ